VTPPKGLEVQPTLDGFRCVVRPRGRRGSNSGWIIVFVAAWWAAASVVAIALTELVPGLLDLRMDRMPLWVWILGSIGLLGWGPAWGVYDSWRSSGTRTLEVTATSLWLGKDSYLLADLVGIERRGTELMVQREHGGTVAVGANGLSHKERDWLKKRLADIIRRRSDPDQPAPVELDELMGRAQD
jgi:hypothetical protein